MIVRCFENILMRILHRRHSLVCKLCLRPRLFRFPLLLLFTLLRVRRRGKGFLERGISKKANTGVDMRDEHDQDQAGSPCGFQSKVAEPPLPPACFSSLSALTSESADFALLYYTLVVDNALPVGYLRELIHVLGEASSSCCKEVVDLSNLNHRFDGFHSSVLHFVENADRRATEIGTIGDQLVIAADMRPKKVSYEVAACYLRRAHSTKGRGSSGTRSLDSTPREFAQGNGHANGKANTR